MAMDGIFDFDNQEYVSEVIVFRDFLKRAIRSRDTMCRCGMGIGKSANWEYNLGSAFRIMGYRDNQVVENLKSLLLAVIDEFRHTRRQYNYDKDDGRCQFAVSKKTPLMSMSCLLKDNDRKRNPQYKSIVLRSMKYDRFDSAIISRCDRRKRKIDDIDQQRKSDDSREIILSDEMVQVGSDCTNKTGQHLHHNENPSGAVSIAQNVNSTFNIAPSSSYNSYGDQLQMMNTNYYIPHEHNGTSFNWPSVNSSFAYQPISGTNLQIMYEQSGPQPISGTSYFPTLPPIGYNYYPTESNSSWQGGIQMPANNSASFFPENAGFASVMNTLLDMPNTPSIETTPQVCSFGTGSTFQNSFTTEGSLPTVPLGFDSAVRAVDHNPISLYSNHMIHKSDKSLKEVAYVKEDVRAKDVQQPVSVETCPPLGENVTKDHHLNDIVAQVSIFVGYPRPLEKQEIRLGRLLKVLDRFLVLGSNTLKDLKNAIDCPADYHVFDDVSGRTANDKDLSKNRYPSSYFFFHDTFYVDLEPEGAQDITKGIRAWAYERGLGEMKVADMAATKFIDLKCRLGAPYLYVHVGACEHLVSFNDIALRDGTHPIGRYPLPFYERNYRRLSCAGCKEITAEWILWDHEGMPVPIQYLCDSCYKEFNFDVCGKKVFEFKAAPLYDRHNKKTDFVEQENSTNDGNAV